MGTKNTLLTTLDREILTTLQEHWATNADRNNTSYQEEKLQYLDKLREKNKTLQSRGKSLTT